MSDGSDEGTWPAFPVPGDQSFPSQWGLTIRDWFAGQALPGIMVRAGAGELREGEGLAQMYARLAYTVADAMLAAREAK